jgi:hypothetical protein
MPVKRKKKILSIKFKVRFFFLLMIRKRSAEGKPDPRVAKVCKTDCKSLQKSMQKFAKS